MPHQENVDWHKARSNVYSLLGNLLSEQPEEKTIDQLLRPEAVGYLEAMFDNPKVGLCFHELADYYSAGRISIDQVALDFESLMRVPGRWYTHPYESAYRSRRMDENNSKWGELCGSQAGDVERYYHSEGLEPSYERVDFADHIGLELIFMAHICRKTAEAMQIKQDNKSEHLLTKQKEFGQNHVLAWADDFCTELKAKASTPFFQAVAEMLAAFVASEKSQLMIH
jgi:TorA maturation chaperone TorD